MDAITQWKTQARKFTTNYKVKVVFCLYECIVTKIVPRECPVDEPTEGLYDIIIGRGLLMTIGLYCKLSENVISVVDEPYEGCTAYILL